MISRTSVTRRQIQQEIYHHDRRVAQARRALDEAKVDMDNAIVKFKFSVFMAGVAWLAVVAYIVS